MSGLSLHTTVGCGADDRQALEQLCRYITWPALQAVLGQWTGPSPCTNSPVDCLCPGSALANKCVQSKTAGQVVLKLRTAWRDDTTQLVMSPLELMRRLAVRLPTPRLHLLRFHGVLAPQRPYDAGHT